MDLAACFPADSEALPHHRPRAAIHVPGVQARPELEPTIAHAHDKAKDRTAPSRLEIVKAIPAGCRRARSQRAFLLALAADPRLAELRADKRRAVNELARVWARHADWRLMTSWRPRARMCAEVGSSRDPGRPLSVTAYQTARAWLEQHGYLGMVSRGWTSRLRASVLDDGTNVSAVFVLTIPRRPEPLPQRDPHPVNRALADSRRESGKAPRAREAKTGKEHKSQRSALTAFVPHPAEPWIASRAPKERSEEESAAEAVRRRCPPLKPLSAKHIRHLLAPWFAAGWSPLDVVHALDCEPGGREHGYIAAVRHLPGWIRSRMSLWLDPTGSPVLSPGQLRTAERERSRAEQSARRAERLRTAERPVDVAGHAARARQMLRESLRARADGRLLAQADRAAQLVLRGPGDVGLAREQQVDGDADQGVLGQPLPLPLAAAAVQHAAHQGQ